MLRCSGTPRIPLAVLLLLCACAWLVPARARAEDAAVDTQAALLLKVVGMDRRHGAKKIEPFNTGVLYDSRKEESVREAEEFIAAMGKGARMNGRPVATHRFDVADADASLEAFIEEHHICLIWMSEGLEAELARVVESTRETDVTSASSDVDLVDQGITVGIETVDGKDRIVINLEAAKEEACEFMASLLKMARVVRTEVTEDPAVSAPAEAPQEASSAP